MIYEIETEFYSGQHPLSYSKWVNTKENYKTLLQELRARTTSSFEKLEWSRLDSGVVFSSSNLAEMRRFVEKAFAMSAECTSNLMQFAKQICCHSESLVGPPPCHYTVIGLGSLARGEATPYSDLEFAYLVENQAYSHYFNRLAMATYFNLNNLGETPLKGFYLEELIDNYGTKKSSSWFKDMAMSGFKFDGITPSAGNIPTGNGLAGSRPLTFTVAELIDSYKKVLESPKGAKTVGNISYFFATTVRIHSTDGGKTIYGEFVSQRSSYEKEASKHRQASQNRVSILKADIEAYQFVPDFEIGYHSQNAQVKSDIFRWPTLLAQNLNIVLLLEKTTPWEVYAVLREQKILSEELELYFQFTLAAALVIRNMAYLAHDTQRELISFLTASTQLDQDRFYVPQSLFIILGCIIVPIKRCILKSLAKLPQEHDITGTIRSVVQQIEIDKDDFITKVGVHYFAGDIKGGLEHLFAVLGENNCKSFDRAIMKLREKYPISRGGHQEKFCITVLAVLLQAEQYYDAAMEFYRQLSFYANGVAERSNYEHSVAHCQTQLGYVPQAVLTYQKILTGLAAAYGVAVGNRLSDHLIALANQSPKAREDLLPVLRLVARVNHNMGYVATINTGSTSPDISDRAYTEAMQLFDFLDQSGNSQSERDHALLYREMATTFMIRGEFQKANQLAQKSLQLFKRAFGQSANQQHIEAVYQTLGDIMRFSGDMEQALQYYQKAAAISVALYGEESADAGMGVTCGGMGEIYGSQNDHDRAILYFQKAIRVHERNASSCSPSDLGLVYQQLGEQQLKAGRYDESLLSLRKALNHQEAAPETGRVIMRRGEVHRLLAEMYIIISDVRNALHHAELAVNHCNRLKFPYFATHLTLAKVHRANGDLMTAITVTERALAMARILPSPVNEVQSFINQCEDQRMEFLCELTQTLSTLELKASLEKHL